MSFRRKPESSHLRQLNEIWTPAFAGVTPFYESIKYRIIKKNSILFPLRESGCSYEQQDTPISGACVHKRMPKLAVGGCCFAAAHGIRPWTPWIWGVLSFRSIRVLKSVFGRSALPGGPESPINWLRKKQTWTFKDLLKSLR